MATAVKTAVNLETKSWVINESSNISRGITKLGKNDLHLGLREYGESIRFYEEMAEKFGGKIYSDFKGSGFLEKQILYAMDNSDNIIFHVDVTR